MYDQNAQRADACWRNKNVQFHGLCVCRGDYPLVRGLSSRTDATHSFVDIFLYRSINHTITSVYRIIYASVWKRTHSLKLLDYVSKQTQKPYTNLQSHTILTVSVVYVTSISCITDYIYGTVHVYTVTVGVLRNCW